MAKVFNLFERFVIRRLAKKVVKLMPEFKEKGLEIAEKYSDEIFEKVKETILKFIEEHKNK